MAGLNALIQKIERLAAGEVKQRIASKVADACHAQCVLGFQQQRDPYGVPWVARKGKRTWPLLDKTGTGSTH
jgi:phage gpG-like protein